MVFRDNAKMPLDEHGSSEAGDAAAAAAAAHRLVAQRPPRPRRGGAGELRPRLQVGRKKKVRSTGGREVAPKGQKRVAKVQIEYLIIFSVWGYFSGLLAPN